MDRKTAADILNQLALPVGRQERTYRTHPDKLAPYWNEVEELLKNDSKLKAYVLFEEMAKRHPGAFDPSWQRTFERRVRDWKLEQRIEKDVTFDQVQLGVHRSVLFGIVRSTRQGNSGLLQRLCRSTIANSWFQRVRITRAVACVLA